MVLIFHQHNSYTEQHGNDDCLQNIRLHKGLEHVRRKHINEKICNGYIRRARNLLRLQTGEIRIFSWLDDACYQQPHHTGYQCCNNIKSHDTYSDPSQGL